MSNVADERDFLEDLQDLKIQIHGSIKTEISETPAYLTY